jgi:DnaJ-class molecular chaperone
MICPKCKGTGEMESTQPALKDKYCVDVCDSCLGKGHIPDSEVKEE